MFRSNDSIRPPSVTAVTGINTFLQGVAAQARFTIHINNLTSTPNRIGLDGSGVLNRLGTGSQWISRRCNDWVISIFIQLSTEACQSSSTHLMRLPNRKNTMPAAGKHSSRASIRVSQLEALSKVNPPILRYPSEIGSNH
jgi:hypothetical protein